RALVRDGAARALRVAAGTTGPRLRVGPPAPTRRVASPRHALAPPPALERCDRLACARRRAESDDIDTLGREHRCGAARAGRAPDAGRRGKPPAFDDRAVAGGHSV